MSVFSSIAQGVKNLGHGAGNALEGHPGLVPKVPIKSNMAELGQSIRPKLAPKVPQTESLQPADIPQGPLKAIGARYREAENRWMKAPYDPKANLSAAERDLTAAQNEVINPALEPRGAPIGILDARIKAYDASMARRAAGLPRQYNTPELPEPRIAPPQPMMEQLGTEAPAPGEGFGRYTRQPPATPAQGILGILNRLRGKQP
jgi:hypothetical protein